MRLFALALALATSAQANPETGTLAISQLWGSEVTAAVETNASGVGRSWQHHRMMGRGTAFIIAEWPVMVGGEEKKLGIELRYIVTSNNSVSFGSVLGAWRGYAFVFRCQSGTKECHSVDLEAGEVTFRNAVVPGGAEREKPDRKNPGLRLNGVWKVKLHLDPDGKVFK